MFNRKFTASVTMPIFTGSAVSPRANAAGASTFSSTTAGSPIA